MVVYLIALVFFIPRHYKYYHTPLAHNRSRFTMFLYMYVDKNVIKGLIIPSHILLSDNNKKTRGNVTKTHEGALLPRVFWSHLHESFVRQQYMTRND